MSLKKIHLVQLNHRRLGRGIALVEEPSLILLKEIRSVYELALKSIDDGIKIQSFIESHLSGETIDYNSVYEGKNEWKLLPSFDHSENPFGCLVSGTGLTHHNSALHRQMMHQSAGDKPTDSMQMYQ